MSLARCVTESLEALTPDARDGAARELAGVYARQLDEDPELLADLGPKLLAALEALGLTPRARAAALKGGQSAARNPLDELRVRRAERAAGAG